jgi:hypothetical protein
MVAGAQTPLWQQAKPAGGKTEAVQYLYPEQVTVAAGKSSPMSLHFRVAPGLHINSHSPKDKFLIPTTLTFPEGGGVKLDAAAYPPGKEFALSADPETKLDVYTGEFAIEGMLTATRGDHLVEARLLYQACDEAQCMPPKTITVAIDVIGK